MNLLNYENYPIGKNIVYKNVCDLIKHNNNILTDNNIIIYQLNWGFGMGSALTVFIENSLYLYKLNKDIISLPMFCINTNDFKYHENKLNNSFFLYFRHKYMNENIFTKYKLYFCYSVHNPNLHEYDIKNVFIKFQIPLTSNINNLNFINYFYNNFEIKIGSHVHEYIRSIKNTNKLIGIHIRSNYQRKIHSDLFSKPECLLNDRLIKLKQKLDKLYTNYTIFIATDVNLYIEEAKSIFGNINYLDNISRINNEGDSVIQLSQYTGFKLGSDILYDCLALSLCDNIYI